MLAILCAIIWSSRMNYGASEPLHVTYFVLYDLQLIHRWLNRLHPYSRQCRSEWSDEYWSLEQCGFSVTCIACLREFIGRIIIILHCFLQCKHLLYRFYGNIITQQEIQSWIWRQKEFVVYMLVLIYFQIITPYVKNSCDFKSGWRWHHYQKILKGIKLDKTQP